MTASSAMPATGAASASAASFRRRRDRTASSPARRPRASSSSRAVVAAANAANAADAADAEDASSSSGAHIVWFRAGDLRVHDHPGLAEAAAMTTRAVIPLFVFDPSEIAHGTPSDARALHEAVVALRASLRALGSDLVVRVGDPSMEMPSVAAALGATSLAAARELEWARVAGWRETLAALRAAGVKCDTWHAPLRARTPAFEEARDATAAAARTGERGAPLCAFASDGDYAAATGGIAAPLPPPASLPATETKTADGDALSVVQNILARSILDADGMPDLETARAWAKMPDSAEAAEYDAAVAAAKRALSDPEFTKRRKMTASTDNAFLMFSEEKMLALAAEESAAAIPSVPFRMPGGEPEVRDFYDGFLDFYSATSNKEYRRMYDVVMENKPAAFFRLFREALALGTLSPRYVHDTARRWEAKSSRATDLCAGARRVAEQRDFQAFQAEAQLDANAEGPGISLVGAYNVVSGSL